MFCRSLEEDVAKVRKEAQDAQRECEKKEEKLISSHQSSVAELQRQHELEMRSLQSQLSHANLQLEDSQRNAATLNGKAETLQANVLQSKIDHEKEIGDMKKHWEIELQERIQRSVGSIEAQVEEVKKGRLHLERDVEKHVETIMRLRQENIALQRASDDKQQSLHQELEKQYKELQEKQDLWAAVTKEKARCEEKIQSHTRRLEAQDARLARMQASYEERIHVSCRLVYASAPCRRPNAEMCLC